MVLLYSRPQPTAVKMSIEPDLSVTMARLVFATDADAGAAGLALAVQRVDRSDLDIEDLLDGELDLCLVRVGGDDERVLAFVDERVALL